MSLPTPQRILDMWSNACVDYHSRTGEVFSPQVLVVPHQDGGWVCSAFIESVDGVALEDVCMHVLSHIDDDKPAPDWVAHCAPIFAMVLDSWDDAPTDPDALSKLAAAGDERVHERVLVTIMGTDTVIQQSFIPPLNEPDGEPDVNEPVTGHVTTTLRAMIFALHAKEEA